MPARTLLQGRSVRLDGCTEADLPTMAEWYADIDFLRALDARVASPKLAHGLKDWLADDRSSKNSFVFAVRLLENRQLVGLVELEGILWQHQVAWLSMAIGPAHQSQGYGSEALQLILEYGFQELNLHRVQLTVFSYNARAIALYERTGFQHEGTSREFLLRDGLRHDMLLYGILRPEWLALQQAGQEG